MLAPKAHFSWQLVRIDILFYMFIFGLDIYRFLCPATPPANPQDGAGHPSNLEDFQAYYRRYLESRVFRDDDHDIQGLPIMQPYHRQNHQQLKPGISIGPPREKQSSCTNGALFRDNKQNDIYILTTYHTLGWTGCEVFQPSAMDVSTQNLLGAKLLNNVCDKGPVTRFAPLLRIVTFLVVTRNITFWTMLSAKFVTAHF